MRNVNTQTLCCLWFMFSLGDDDDETLCFCVCEYAKRVC